MAKGLNLIFRYQFMVFPLVPFCTSKSLRIFHMGYITVYMVHVVAPQLLVHCIIILLGNIKIFCLSLMVNIPSLSTPCNICPFRYFGSQLMYVLCLFLYESLFDVEVNSKIIRTYACMVSPPAPFHAFCCWTDHWHGQP